MKKKANPKLVKKKKQLPVGEKAFKQQLEQWQEACETRGKIGQAAYDFQDADTRNAIDRIQDRLRVGATTEIELRVGGQSRKVQVEPKYLNFNILFLATEILKDMALMDIRVANYKFPPLCADCGKKLEKKKPRQKGKK